MVTKRDGRVVPYDANKVRLAIYMAITDTNISDLDSTEVTDSVMSAVNKKLSNIDPNYTTINVEDIQDYIVASMKELNLPKLAKSFTSYRNKRTRIRDKKSNLMKRIGEMANSSAKNSNNKRENANINGDTAMGTMLKFGTTSSKEYYLSEVIPEKPSNAHIEGYIHIHDLDFYDLTTTCTQIGIGKLLAKGFSTGHGHLRTPTSITSAAALSCIAIQSNQNDQHGGQSIPTFDYDLGLYVGKSFITNICEYLDDNEVPQEDINTIKVRLKDYHKNHNTIMEKENLTDIEHIILDVIGDTFVTPMQCINKAIKKTDRDTYQAMEALVHNLNTMNSRAGAQVPFSSINFGTDTSVEGRMVSKNLLLAQEAGLGNGETPIFPILIFKVKEGINYNPEDPNYDLFKLACKVSAKRLFPNFCFIDAPFNLQYYKPGNPDSEIATMGCRTRVIGDINDVNNQIVTGRGNLSFTSINLPRLAIESKGNLTKFYELLDDMLDLVRDQLLHRYSLQCKKTVRNYPFLMGQGVWKNSEQLGIDDTLEDVLKHGTLSIGFIGLAETLTALIGKHHGESEEAQKLGLEIIKHMRDYTDKMSEIYSLNFSLLATPAEGLSGRFVQMDKARYGVIPGVTDKEYYTNSVHVPVSYMISAYKKIQLEAPYHELCNAGHICYVELDGDPSDNLEAFESVVRCMKDCGIGYGSINHPVDRDPVCGYIGIIGDVCPCCGRREGEALTPEMYKEIIAKNRLGGPYGT